MRAMAAIRRSSITLLVRNWLSTMLWRAAAKSIAGKLPIRRAE
jgi:hypothetical protein